MEKEYAPLYAKYGTGLTTFSALKGGFLTGKYDNEVIPENTRFSSSTSTDSWVSGVIAKIENKDPEIIRNITISRALKVCCHFYITLIIIARKKKQKTSNPTQPIAAKLGITQGQLALAWVIKNPNISSAIVGASRVEQVYENMQALKAVPLLTPEIMAEIDAAAGNKPVLEPRRYD